MILSLRLLPDFVGRAVIVGLPVGVVGVLVGVEIFVSMFRGQILRHADRTVGSIGRVGVENICAVGMQNLFALERDVFRHAQRHRESLGRPQHGVCDPGIAAGGIEKNLAHVELPAPEALRYDARGSAVFD